MANYCSACGQAVAPDAKFCANCGSALEDTQPRESDLPATEPEQPTIEPEQPATDPAPEPEPPSPSSTEEIDSYLAKIEASVIRTWRQLFNIPEPQTPAHEPKQPVPEPLEPEQSSQPPETSVPEPSQPAPEQRNEGGGASRVLKGCGIAVGVVVGLFIVLLILGAIFGEPRDEDGTKAPAPVQETNTEQKEQPAPTAQPVPTATPIPLCKREAESQYIVALAEFMDVIGTSSADAGERFTELGQNPALILTSEWRDGLALSMGIMLFAATSISELEAPESLDEVDEVAKRMASQLEDALYLSAAAIDDIDPDKLEQANQIFLELPKLTLEIGDITSRVCGQ